MMRAMDTGFDGRVVLVTGAASGIGRATAAALAGMGARIVASDIDAEAGAAAARALGDGGADVRFVAGDVADAEAIGAVVAAAVDAWGRLDAAANCAGVGAGHAETHAYPVDAWDRIVAVNLRGTWLAMRAEIPRSSRTATAARSSTSRPRWACAARRTRRPTARASTASSASRARPRSSTRSAASASTRSARARSTRR